MTSGSTANGSAGENKTTDSDLTARPLPSVPEMSSSVDDEDDYEADKKLGQGNGSSRTAGGTSPLLKKKCECPSPN